MADQACIKAIKDAAPHLDDAQAAEIDDAIAKYRARRRAEGSAKADEETAAFAQEMKDEAAAAAYIEKRNRLINIIRTDARMKFYESVSGRGTVKKFEALSEGSQRGFFGAGLSSDAQGNSLHGAFMGKLYNGLGELVGKVSRATPQFDADLANELGRITDPNYGRDTGNADAKKAAAVIHSVQEEARKMSNDAGAWIKQLPGWIVRQSHDMWRVRRAGKEEWVAFIRPMLKAAELAKIGDATAVDKWLGETWLNIASGMHLLQDGAASATDAAFTGMANLAKRISAERVLHFKDADAWVSYNRRFGTGNVMESAMRGLDRASRNISLMRVYGPNPMAAHEADRVRLSEAARRKKDFATVGMLSDKSNFMAKRRAAMGYQTGDANIPGNPTWAAIGATARGAINGLSLGFSTISSITDLGARAATLRYAGIGYLERLNYTFGDLFAGGAEKKEANALIGVGVEGWRNSAMSRFSATDNLPGTVAKIQDLYFRLNFLTQWTDFAKGGAGRMLSRHLAGVKGLAYDGLDSGTRGALGRYGIDATRWDIIRQSDTNKLGIGEFLTSDGIRHLPDTAFEPLVKEYMARFVTTETPGRRAVALREVRQDLEMRLQTYFVDIANDAVSQPGAAERATLYGGYRPGSPIGEGLRFFTQFHSYTASFMNKQLGREFLRGADENTGYGLGAMKTVSGMGLTRMIVAMVALGYISDSITQVLHNKTPRDPRRLDTWATAFVKSGGFGIYSDFLFGDFNRYGRGFWETVGGPAVGKVSDLARIFSDIKEGRDPSSGLFQFGSGFIPNIFYTKMALDYLILDRFREWLAPGSQRRYKKTLQDQGQDFIFQPAR